MLLQHLKINRIIIHQVFRRGEDSRVTKPWQSHEFTNFDKAAMEAFKLRVIKALGHDSKAVQMEIVNQNLKQLPNLIDEMVEQEDDNFAVSSYDIAMKLAKAQQSRNIPGGIVVVFDGKQGLEKKKFLGIIKADIHSAYEKETNPKTKEISLKFVEEVLLTPSNRLYKTVGFFEKSFSENASHDLNDKWMVMIADYQINKVDGKAAAKYFYSDFLGCNYLKNSARETKQFYDYTKDYIDNLDLPQDEKIDYYNALVTYIKVDTSTNISAIEFARKYFDNADIRDAFISYMKESGLPSTAFTKDTEYIVKKLKTRRVDFGRDIRIVASPEAFRDRVVIETINSPHDESENPPVWTNVLIKDRISGQE